MYRCTHLRVYRPTPRGRMKTVAIISQKGGSGEKHSPSRGAGSPFRTGHRRPHLSYPPTMRCPVRPVPLLLVVLLLVLGCEGPVGPSGPAGPQGTQGAVGQTGPQGLPGDDALVYGKAGYIDEDGKGFMRLPDYDYLPAVSCYISEDAFVWLHVDQNVGSPYAGCAIVTDTDGNLWVQIGRGPPGWHFYITAVF